MATVHISITGETLQEVLDVLYAGGVTPVTAEEAPHEPSRFDDPSSSSGLPDDGVPVVYDDAATDPDPA